MLNKSKKFYCTRPRARDFQEEKKSVLEGLVPELHAALSSVETAVCFGSVRGDIDIGLISSQRPSNNELDEILPPILNQYPIVDQRSITYFKSRDAVEFVDRMILTNFEQYGLEHLHRRARKNVRKAIKSAKLMWGDESVIEGMHDVLEYRINNQTFLNKFT